ncbi:MAG TPA: hypothetical protein VFO41_17315 [Alphaproteobacteria bacterium]|nr:hypothetical protein [Alphaproteobacteria bacterium]
MMLSYLPRLRLPLCVSAVLLAGGLPATGLSQTEEQGPGWAPVIAGAPASMDPEEFQKAVVAELPEEMFNRATNFTSHDAYRPNADYRLVMVFHGAEDSPNPEELCSVGRTNPEEVETTKPELDDLMQTTGITAAFCEDDETLSIATDKISGKAEPGQLSFGFLVSDVAKQLFPDGFAIMPQRQSIRTFETPQ